jgi:tRNA-dihydrouridine synthase
MVQETGCDGVVVGRGCLGRPWLFGDLASAFTPRGLSSPGSGRIETTAKAEPTLGEVSVAFRRHAELLIEFFDGDEGRACRDIRKHVAWYFKGYPVGGELRAALARSSSLDEIDELLGHLDPSLPYPGAEAEGQRGRAGTPKQPALPERWLESRELQETHRATLTEGEGDTSGG